MKAITIHADAEAELWQALHYYETQRSGLGGEFRREFELALHRVRANPLAYAPRDDSGARYCRLRRFPYTLIYIELEEAIWILAVAHQRRRPRYWSQRRADPGTQ